MNVNCRISSCLETLIKYNKKYNWVPGPENIRPNKETIKAKKELFNSICEFYMDITDYIYSEIFKYPVIFINGKLKAVYQDTKEFKFIKNKFRYNLPKNVKHYILWYSYNNIDDQKINNDINNSIYKILNHNNYKYVWYENPKMNIPNIYHLQVFWIETI